MKEFYLKCEHCDHLEQLDPKELGFNPEGSRCQQWQGLTVNITGIRQMQDHCRSSHPDEDSIHMQCHIYSRDLPN